MTGKPCQAALIRPRLAGGSQGRWLVQHMHLPNLKFHMHNGGLRWLFGLAITSLYGITILISNRAVQCLQILSEPSGNAVEWERHKDSAQHMHSSPRMGVWSDFKATSRLPMAAQDAAGGQKPDQAAPDPWQHAGSHAQERAHGACPPPGQATSWRQLIAQPLYPERAAALSQPQHMRRAVPSQVPDWAGQKQEWASSFIRPYSLPRSAAKGRQGGSTGASRPDCPATAGSSDLVSGQGSCHLCM